VGRAVHVLDDEDPAARVLAEAQAELRAIHGAEIGDFSGRARQAVLISRAVASLEQVAAADALLSADPLGSDRLFTAVDPTAAVVPAAHWLRAAATIVADRAGLDPLEVVAHADDLEIMPVRTTAAVLKRLSVGESPRDVVVDLVDKAMQVAKGELPARETLVTDVQAARRRRRRGHHARVGETEEPPRASLLDPTRPSRDLLEVLLEGIRGCWLLYQEYADDTDDGPEGCDDSDDADTGARRERMTATFRDEVRSEVAATRDRLL
jgi:hypothetical protein